jgi:ATP synthase protein I
MKPGRRAPSPEFADDVGRKAGRKIRARDAGRSGVWFGLGMFGLIGWSIAVPVLVGILIGMQLDAWLQDRVSWTLTMMFVGLALGCINAWHWMTREGRQD